MGKLSARQGQLLITEKEFNKALNIFPKASYSHPDIHMVFEGMAEFYLKKSIAMKNTQHLFQDLKIKASSYLRQALEIVKAYFSKNSPHIQRIQLKLKALEFL